MQLLIIDKGSVLTDDALDVLLNDRVKSSTQPPAAAVPAAMNNARQ